MRPIGIARPLGAAPARSRARAEPGQGLEAVRRMTRLAGGALWLAVALAALALVALAAL